MTRRQFVKTMTFAAGALLAGCGPKGVPGARVTLTQWYHQYGEKGTQDAVMRYAQEYTKLHPDIAIQVVWVPGDYGTKLATALLTSGGPDVFEGSVSAAMVGAGQIVPLDDLFTPDVRKDFSARDIELNSVSGKVYGVKTLDDLGLLYFRKSVLAAAGIEPPQTMDALIAAAKKLSNGDRKGLFLGNDGGVSSLLNLMPWSAGADFLVNNKIVFNTDRSVAAFEKLRELDSSGALLSGAPTDWWDPSAFTEGLSAMQWCGLWAYPAIKKAFGNDVGAVVWPALDTAGTPATFLGGWSCMVNAQNDNIVEAKKYVKWLWIDNAKNQLDWCVGYGFHVPPRASVAGMTQALKDPVPAYAVDAVQKYGRFLPTIWNASMTSALTDAVTNSLKRGLPIASELGKAASKCERELSRALE